MELKGDRRGLRLLANHFSSDEELIKDLRRTLEENKGFLNRASLLIEISGQALTPGLFEKITEVFQGFPGLSLRGIQQGDSQSLIPLDQRAPDLVAPPKVIRHTIRSGQRMSHPGDLIIVGDVNPGATVIAGGDVMVFGWLRGTVYAGQPEDSSRVVYALRFDPSQVRIASRLALGDSEGNGNPEKALIEDGELVVKPWQDVRLPEAITQERISWEKRFSSATSS